MKEQKIEALGGIKSSLGKCVLHDLGNEMVKLLSYFKSNEEKKECQKLLNG